MRHQLTWMLALRGAAALSFAVMALVWPEVTALALALLFGAYALVDGVTWLASALRRDGDRRHRLIHAVGGLLGVTAGLVSLAWPGVTALALVGLVGTWAVVTGVAEIWAAVRFRRELHHEGVLFLAGAASVIAGILVWARPDAGAVAIAQVTGVCALISGALVLAAAWRLHNDAGAGSPARHARHARHA
ncbi:HdeD family acid-resistance protein [Streptomyces sp. NPDC102395]|uniref:HdeD family acid-resistance protein n=1 Tax=Streptomyces sp. NPDC102395 TaxID=3366168 RepID=UPI0037F65C32